MDVQGSHPSTHTLSLADSLPENRWGRWHGTPPLRCEDPNVAGVDGLQPVGVPSTMPHAGVAIHFSCSSSSSHFAAGGDSSSSRIEEALVLPPQRL